MRQGDTLSDCRGSLAFAVSTIVRDGNGSAVVVLIIGIVFWIGRGMFDAYPRFDVFLNPFSIPRNVSDSAWAEIVSDNRLYLMAGSVITLLLGLLNLQKREKFL